MKRIKVEMFDDLDHQADETALVPADETLRLALDGQVVELDLTTVHAKELRELLAPYLAAGSPPDDQPRKLASPPPGKVPREGSRSYNKAMREYAGRRGITLNQGYLPVSLRLEFKRYIELNGWPS